MVFDDKHFDEVIAVGLLDYVVSPHKALLECARVLKDNGTIVFTLPKRPSLFWLLRTGIGKRLRKEFFGLPPVKNILSKQELVALAESSGFKVLYLESVWTTMWVAKAVKVK